MMKKKILIFSDCFIYGGCEIVVTNLANSQKINNDFEVLYSYRNFKEYDEGVRSKVDNNKKLIPVNLLSNDTYLYKLNFKRNFLYNNFVGFFLRLISFIGIYKIVNSINLFLLFNRVKPDIIFINNGGYPGSELNRLAVLVAGINNNKIIFNVNNLAFKPKYFYEKIYDRLINNKILSFITASDSAKERLSKARGFPINKIKTFPNSVKEINIISKKSPLKKEFFIKNDSIILGAVGLLTKRKGFSVLLNSLKILIEKFKYKNIKLFIVGEGEERKNLEQQIKLNKLNGFVELVGFKTNVLEYMNGFDIFILPSIDNEDIPHVIIEAMMLRKPVIASRVAGAPEAVIDGVTGLIVTPNDPMELSNSISSLISNKSLIEEYGKNGYNRYVKLFEYEVIMKKYNDFFLSL